MLNNGRYSFSLRQRILGDKGHLSNYDSAKYLSDFIGDNTRYVLLAHLSEENKKKYLMIKDKYENHPLIVNFNVMQEEVSYLLKTLENKLK